MADIKTQLSDAVTDSSTVDVVDGQQNVPAAKGGDDSASTKTVSLEAFNEVLNRLKTTNQELENVKGGMAFIQKVKDVLVADQSGHKLSDRDQVILEELHRLKPELKYLDSIPEMVKALQSAGEQSLSNIAEAAWSYQQRLQKEYGVAEGDPETSVMIGTNVREWIFADRSRAARYKAGDQEIVREGFEHVVNKLYGADRIAKKRRDVERAKNAPKVPTSKGGGTGASEAPKVDFKNSKSVKAALREYAGSMGRSEE